MKRAKQAKQTGTKATLDHAIGSTGRDGAFDFASRTELLNKMAAPPKRARGSAKAAEFEKNAEQCAREASRATEPKVRASYEKLSRSWRELAQEATALARKSDR